MLTDKYGKNAECLREKTLFLFDMDGTIYEEDRLFEGTKPLLASIRRRGAPVEIPDFTRGKWQHREPVTPGRYCLDVVCDADGRPI